MSTPVPSLEEDLVDMYHARIINITAKQDLVDHLLVRVRLPGPALVSTQQYLLVGFQGILAFYKDNVPPGAGPSAACSLPATWLKSPTALRHEPKSEKLLDFEVPMSKDAFLRLEEYRAGEVLFARIEGQVQLITRSNPGPQATSETVLWLDGLQTDLASPDGPPIRDLRSECFEFHQERWSRDVRSILHPPGSFFFEFTVPESNDFEGVKDVIVNMEKARKAFVGGNYSDVLKAVLEALKAMAPEGHRIEERYGDAMRKLFDERLEGLKQMCDVTPPKGLSTRKTIDRTLAHHVFADASSLMGFVFKS